MTAQLNTNLFPIIEVGMYCSHLAPDSMFDDYLINDDFEEGYIDFNAEQYWERFNNDKYVKAIQKCAGNYLDGQIVSEEFEIDGVGVEITVKCGEIYSPKYYNFATDQIDLTVDYDKEEVLKLAKEFKEGFSQFLNDNYSSYDGFISHTANNFSEWLEDFGQDNVQAIGAVLTFLFKGNIESENEDLGFVQYVNENIYYSEFID